MRVSEGYIHVNPAAAFGPFDSCPPSLFIYFFLLLHVYQIPSICLHRFFSSLSETRCGCISYSLSVPELRGFLRTLRLHLVERKERRGEWRDDSMRFPLLLLLNFKETLGWTKKPKPKKKGMARRNLNQNPVQNYGMFLFLLLLLYTDEGKGDWTGASQTNKIRDIPVTLRNRSPIDAPVTHRAGMLSNEKKKIKKNVQLPRRARAQQFSV